MQFSALATKSLSMFFKVSLLTYQIFPVNAKKKKKVGEVCPGSQNTRSAKKGDHYNIK